MDKKHKAFDILKQVVTSTPVLVSPQDLDLFRIEADSFNFATGAVLSQQSPTDGRWYLVVFYSKLLSLVEQNYEIYNKEILAIIWALEEWRYFLERTAHLVEIWIDHKNLEYFMMAKKLNRYQARWFLYLAHFNFTLCYQPRQFIEKPNILSWGPDHGTRAGDNKSIILLQLEFFAVWALEGVKLTEEEQKVLFDI